MPAWEIALLLDRLGHYLPHILYGADGAHAQQNQPRQTDDVGEFARMVRI